MRVGVSEGVNAAAVAGVRQAPVELPIGSVTCTGKCSVSPKHDAQIAPAFFNLHKGQLWAFVGVVFFRPIGVLGFGSGGHYVNKVVRQGFFAFDGAGRINLEKPDAHFWGTTEHGKKSEETNRAHWGLRGLIWIRASLEQSEPLHQLLPFGSGRF